MRFKPRNTIVAHLDVGELLPLKVVHSGLKRVQLSDKNTRIPGEQWPKLFRLDTHVDKEVDSRRHITFEVKANSKAGSPGFTEKDTNSFWLFMTEPWKKVKFVHFPIKFAPVFFKAWSCCEEISAIYRQCFETYRWRELYAKTVCNWSTQLLDVSHSSSPRCGSDWSREWVCICWTGIDKSYLRRLRAQRNSQVHIYLISNTYAFNTGFFFTDFR